MKHLINIDKLSTDDIHNILYPKISLKSLYLGNIGGYSPQLQSKNVAMLFYENSTRTRCSFELAAKLLKYNVINLDINTSAEQKGETIKDTVANLIAMGIDIIVIRHKDEQLIHSLVKKFGNDVSFINAGNGTEGHPSQALLDYYTMSQYKHDKVVIVGDILHSRVAKSNIQLLNKYDIDVHIVGPKELLPETIHNCKVTKHNSFNECLQDTDIIMCLRTQHERIGCKHIIKVIEEIAHTNSYKIDRKLINKYCPNVKVMHPGPVNREVDLTDDVLDDKSLSLVLDQVKNGVLVRKGIYEWLN